MLVLERDRAHPREELVERLWTESDSASGQSNLTFTIHALRLALSSVGVRDNEFLTIAPDGALQISLPVSAQFDIDLFRGSLRRARDARRAGRKEESAQLLRAAVAIHRGELVLDPFGGVGTTLIAAEKTGRVARLIECDPTYCDTIVRRFACVTGAKAIEAVSGRSFEEVTQERTALPTATEELER